jgi:hypothetical protein
VEHSGLFANIAIVYDKLTVGEPAREEGISFNINVD